MNVSRHTFRRIKIDNSVKTGSRCVHGRQDGPVRPLNLSMMMGWNPSSNMKVIKINVRFAYLNKIRSCVYFIARILTWLYFPISAHFHLEEKRVEHWFSLKIILLSQKNLKRTSKENVWMQFLNKQHYFHAKGVVQRLVHVKTAVWPLVLVRGFLTVTKRIDQYMNF